MSETNPSARLVSFFVFDHVSKGPYTTRLAKFSAVCQAGKPTLPILAVHQMPVISAAELIKAEEVIVKAGYEGVMLRSPNGPYKHGRSTLNEQYLLKWKRFEDSEAVILGVEEQMHNSNRATRNKVGYTKRSSAKDGMVPMGTLGSLRVRDLKTNVEFNIGSGIGLTQHARQQMWDMRKSLPGLIVKYRFQPVGVKEAPRFPRMIGFRSRIDM